MSDTFDAARYYASEYDWPIFLCHACSKRPLVEESWKHEATTDPRKIERLLRKFPEANIASPAGFNWDVLDVDDADAARMLREHGVLPITVKQRTPGGPDRTHYFLRHQDGITNRRGRLPKGIDVRGKGGYVLLPPSKGPNGSNYEWLTSPDESDLASWPRWLVEMVQGSSENGSIELWDPLDVEAIFQGVSQGERDEKAYRYAASLRSRSVRKREAIQLMTAAWEQMDQPAQDNFPLDAALEKVERIYREKKAGKSSRYEDKATTPLRVRSPDMAKAQPVEWIWHHRVPEGYLSLLLGEEGVGKGTLIVWVIAQLSRGDLDGDCLGSPVHVGIIGDEDDFDSVWTPRLQAAAADFEYVHYIDRSDFGYVELEADQQRIATVVEEFEIRLLYLDQLLDNLGVKVDDWRRKEVRQALRPARALARELSIAVLGSLHPNKRGNSFRELLSGSVAFNAVSRSSLLLARRIDDPERRALVRGKGNLCPDPSAFEFEIKEFTIRHHGEVFRGPTLDQKSIAHTDLSKDELIGQVDTDAESKVGKARALILQMLPNDGKGHPCKPILEEGERQGLEYHTLSRARHKLGIVSYRDTKFQGDMFWKWPFHVKTVRKRTR